MNLKCYYKIFSGSSGARDMILELSSCDDFSFLWRMQIKASIIANIIYVNLPMAEELMNQAWLITTETKDPAGFPGQ